MNWHKGRRQNNLVLDHEHSQFHIHSVSDCRLSDVSCGIPTLLEIMTSVVNKDLSFKAKAKDLTVDIRTRSRTALDYGVRENIKLRKSNSTVAQVHAINTLFTDLWSTVGSFMR